MIVLNYNDTIYIAKSCWGMRDPEARKSGVPDLENLCMWHPKNNKNRLIAASACGRFTDIVRYEDIFPSVLDRKSLIFESYDEMHYLADRFGLCDDDGDLPTLFVFAEGDKAYVLCGDGGHVEVENIFSVNCCNEAVMALYDLEGVKDPYEFFKKAYLTIEKIRNFAMFPVTVMNTKTNKVKVIKR